MRPADEAEGAKPLLAGLDRAFARLGLAWGDGCPGGNPGLNLRNPAGAEHGMHLGPSTDGTRDRASLHEPAGGMRGRVGGGGVAHLTR